MNGVSSQLQLVVGGVPPLDTPLRMDGAINAGNKPRLKALARSRGGAEHRRQPSRTFPCVCRRWREAVEWSDLSYSLGLLPEEGAAGIPTDHFFEDANEKQARWLQIVRTHGAAQALSARRGHRRWRVVKGTGKGVVGGAVDGFAAACGALATCAGGGGGWVVVGVLVIGTVGGAVVMGVRGGLDAARSDD